MRELTFLSFVTDIYRYISHFIPLKSILSTFFTSLPKFPPFSSQSKTPSFFLMPTSDNPDVVVEVRRSLHCPVRHCPHHGPGPLLPPLFSHSYTAQLPPLDPPTTSVVWLNQIKSPMQWRGYNPPPSHQREFVLMHSNY